MKTPDTERAKEHRRKYKEKVKAATLEAATMLVDTKYNTALKAIMAHCRMCENGKSRGGLKCPKAHLVCGVNGCFLFPFRNGDPKKSLRGFTEKDRIKKMRAAR